MIFGTTVMPWIFGLLSLLLMICIGITANAWRNAKRSPFFFLRRQAQKQMQLSASVAVVLSVLLAAIGTYMQQVEPLQSPRVALITNTKPADIELVADVVEDQTAIVFNATSDSLAQTADENPLLTPLESLSAVEEVSQELPSEFNQFEANADLTDATALGKIAFGSEMSDEFTAVNPGRIFEEGLFTIYATFSYDGMDDGMVWAWVWRYNGEVIGGGNEVWSYGADGPGYIFLAPEDGFIPGEYDLQIWVNEELLSDSRMFVTATVASGQ